MKQLLIILAALLSIAGCTNNVKVGNETVNYYACQRAVDSAKVKIPNIPDWRSGDILFRIEHEIKIIGIDICNGIIITVTKVCDRCTREEYIWSLTSSDSLFHFKDYYNKTAAERAGTLK